MLFRDYRTETCEIIRQIFPVPRGKNNTRNRVQLTKTNTCFPSCAHNAFGVPNLEQTVVLSVIYHFDDLELKFPGLLCRK